LQKQQKLEDRKSYHITLNNKCGDCIKWQGPHTTCRNKTKNKDLENYANAIKSKIDISYIFYKKIKLFTNY